MTGKVFFCFNPCPDVIFPEIVCQCGGGGLFPFVNCYVQKPASDGPGYEPFKYIVHFHLRFTDDVTC